MVSFFSAKKISEALCFFVLLISDELVHSLIAQSVPAVYVFGDSLVDVGNNNHLTLSILRADFPYNGMDYPGRIPTGRFCNGKNAADFLAEKLGLSTAPPYLSQPNNAFLKGVSFASGGAGILNNTNQNQVVSLAQQVNYFSTVRQRMVKELGTEVVNHHLSKSLITIVIGSNDMLNYFDEGSDLSKNSTPQDYVSHVVSTFRELLEGIQGVGARKFLVLGLPQIGCAPQQRLRNNNTICNKEMNFWSKKYNKRLLHMLHELKSEIKEFHFSYFDTYSVVNNFIKNRATYGFKVTNSACCGLGKLRASIPCTPVSLHCSNRSNHLFWDIYHPTEMAVRMFMDILFDGSADYVSPMTVKQLIAI